jgi:hypothetical protein
MAIVIVETRITDLRNDDEADGQEESALFKTRRLQKSAAKRSGAAPAK